MILIPLVAPDILQVRNQERLPGKGCFVLLLFSDVFLAGHCHKASALTHHLHSYVLIYGNKCLVLNNRAASAGTEPVKDLQVQHLIWSPMIWEIFFRPGSMSGRGEIQAWISPSQGRYILGIVISFTDCFKQKQVIVISAT